NLLKVVDFSKGDSILNLWVEEPNVKTDGIFFVGGIPQGFNGKGRILRIIFQVEKDGQGNIDFAENSRALLNDGLGTPAKFAAQGAVITVLPGKSVIPSDAWKKELERDKTAPEPFKIEIGRDLSVLEGKYFLSFVAADKQTGIDHYEVKEGEGDWVRAERPYLLQDQSLKSKILVKAVDKAGNEKVVEYTSPRKLFSYWIIIAVLVVGLVIWRVIKRFKR
ncbi:MAG: hypothetical protein Q7R46_01260, partial [bacterium]|nr:hypothetical protein [bacterium]